MTAILNWLSKADPNTAIIASTALGITLLLTIIGRIVYDAIKGKGNTDRENQTLSQENSQMKAEAQMRELMLQQSSIIQGLLKQHDEKSEKRHEETQKTLIGIKEDIGFLKGRSSKRDKAA